MKETRDTSVSVALAELDALEKERLSNEQCEREARAQRHAEAVARAAERARRAEEERAQAEANRRREDEERRRFEEARIDAMQRGEVERIRAEVEVRARAERERRAHVHAVELEKAKALAARGSHRMVFGVCTAGLLGLGVLSSWLWVKVGALESELAHASAMSTMDHDAYDRTLRDLETVRREASGLRKTLDAAQSSFGGTAPSASAPGIQGVPLLPRRRGGPARAAVVPVSCTNDGDPMNGCLSK